MGHLWMIKLCHMKLIIYVNPFRLQIYKINIKLNICTHKTQILEELVPLVLPLLNKASNLG